MISFFDAFLLSLIEGLTEFIPVSSTGHMILLSSLLGIKGEGVETFEIFIQLGAILSVVVLFPSRFLALIPKSEKTDNANGLAGKQGIAKFIVACAPVFILGFLFHKKIKALLFSPMPVAMALIVGGLLLIFLERRKTTAKVLFVEQITLKQSFLIGLAQCLALWPGISRSGSTIIGGMLLGLERRVAAEFSFLVAVPVMFVAVGYDLLKSIHSLSSADFPIFLFGFICAFLISLVAVKYFLELLGRVTLEGFGWYRVVLGVVVIIFK